MKIKISDLVNKVINREEMPKGVLFDGNIYKWCGDIGDYRKDGYGSCLMIRDVFGNFERYGSFYNMLFENVEIIEEPKKIEKWGEGALEEMENCTDYTLEDLQKYIRILAETQNELIDEINNLKEND